jgi:ribosomal protein RSM22 (predicted rRNA methylase)
VDLARLLARGGALVVLEPGLRATSRVLMAVRDALAARGEKPFVVAPCTRAGLCPMGERDWCHSEIRTALPARAAALARAAGLRDDVLTFSYLTLRNEPRTLAALAPWRVVSGRLASKGKTELVVCGEPGLVRLRRLDREASEPNRRFDALGRGSLCTLDPAPAGAAARIGPDVRVL